MTINPKSGWDSHASSIALEDGIELREWIERVAQEVSFKTIRCATYTVSAPGLQWLRRLTRGRQVRIRLLSDVAQTDPRLVRSITKTMFASGEIECRTAPARPGPRRDEQGLFHPKILILDDVAAVVGSVNLTGKGLGLGIQPHNVEMSVGLSEISSQPTIKQLVEVFDRWWEGGQPLCSHFDDQSKKENQHMAQPEYVVFRDRPRWGIAQVQTEGSSLFGQEQWLAVSDISPVDPEHRPARIQVPQQFVEAVKPKPWDTPAAQLALLGVAAVSNSKEHFRRLAAYWLQAENRSGQLDSVPVLQLRHQTSLVEHLSRSDTPREMLIADEVGLGKTVEIGLLLERLMAAKPDLRVLYVTPGGLVTNVIDEFKNMGLDGFWVFANSSLDEEKYPQARLGRENHDPCVVASLHRLGFGSNPERQLSNTQWDVVIADECHRLRMYGTGDGQNAQKWFRLFEQIIGRHLAQDGRVYFLSGTPHQGNREVFLNMISLMCRLGRRASQEEQRRAIAGRVIYRTKEEVRDWDDLPVFPRRNVQPPSYADNPPEYNTLLSDIAEFFDWLQYNDSLANKKRALGFVKSHALQYAASSPKAGFAFLLRRCLRHFADEMNEKTLLEWVSLLIPYRQWSASQKPERLLEELRKSVREDESGYDEEDDDLDDSVGPSGSSEMRQEEKQRLSQLLRKYALLMASPQAKAKFNVLTQLLEVADEPFVVFAQSVDTVFEVKRHVEQRGIQCCVIVGGQDPSERRKAIDDFTKPGRLGRRVLVSSAAGGEGINLQIARRLIHFDLPWNPMVLEQRIGRVHRIGTIKTIIVETILLKDSREADIYWRLTTRLWHIVTDLAESERQREQYFRRIMAGIPLETLRYLFSGPTDGDDAAIGAAVKAGKQHVDQVDAELRRHRVTELPDEKGRASMEHLVELLEESGKITEIKAPVNYNKVRFDPDTNSFRAEKRQAIRYRVNDGRKKETNHWAVFDREAAARSPDVSRDKSGGINHPIVALALQTLRTAQNIEDLPRLALGLGTYDKEDLAYFSNGADEPVVLLSYLVAHLRDEHFFNHELRLFALSPSNPRPERLGPNDGELVEYIIWTNLRKDNTEFASPDLDQSFLKEVSSQDARIREELGSEVKDEEGRWRGAVWPLAVTVLLPTA